MQRKPRSQQQGTPRRRSQSKRIFFLISEAIIAEQLPFRRAARFANRRLDAVAKENYLEMGLLTITILARNEPITKGEWRPAIEV